MLCILHEGHPAEVCSIGPNPVTFFDATLFSIIGRFLLCDLQFQAPF